MPRILITRISSFGDVAMLVPVVYSVAARYPQDRFIVLTRKAFAPLFENLGFNVGTKSFDKNRHSSFLGLLKLSFSLRRGGYSHVADMHDVLRTKFIRTFLLLNGKKVAHIDKGRNEKKEAIENKRLSPPLKHTIERYMDVMVKIGFPAENTFTNFFEFRERSLYPLRTIIKEKNGKWIGIAPFSKHEGKIYPLRRMEKVLSVLVQQPDITVFLFSSGNKERALMQHWEGKYEKTICVSGKLNLENELLLISFLDIMISMDSANMHLASLVQTPVISVWGATHPALGFYGYKQDERNIVQTDIECRPCSVFGDLPCMRNDYACMRTIKEGEIIHKINEVFSRKEKVEI